MKDIKGFEGLYAVTSCGKVWSYKSEKFLKPQINSSGYCFVRLYKDGFPTEAMIHRLVAEAYIPNPDNLETVDHKDNNKYHNYLQNLQWMTRGGNVVKDQGYRILCVETGEHFKSIRECARKMNLHHSGIRKVLEGAYKSTGGYTFRYAEDD